MHVSRQINNYLPPPVRTLYACRVHRSMQMPHQQGAGSNHPTPDDLEARFTAGTRHHRLQQLPLMDPSDRVGAKVKAYADAEEAASLGTGGVHVLCTHATKPLVDHTVYLLCMHVCTHICTEAHNRSNANAYKQVQITECQPG